MARKNATKHWLETGHKRKSVKAFRIKFSHSFLCSLCYAWVQPIWLSAFTHFKIYLWIFRLVFAFNNFRFLLFFCFCFRRQNRTLSIIFVIQILWFNMIYNWQSPKAYRPNSSFHFRFLSPFSFVYRFNLFSIDTLTHFKNDTSHIFPSVLFFMRFKVSSIDEQKQQKWRKILSNTKRVTFISNATMNSWTTRQKKKMAQKETEKNENGESISSNVKCQ